MATALINHRSSGLLSRAVSCRQLSGRFCWYLGICWGVGAGLRAGRAAVTLVTVREGCWGPGGQEPSPRSEGRSSETAIHSRGRQVSVGQVPGRDFGACLRRNLQGRAELPGCRRASGRRGHLLLEKAAGAVLLRAAFPAPRSFYAPDSFLPSTCCW